MPNVQIVGAESGTVIEELSNGKLFYDSSESLKLVERINGSGAEFVAVAFGMGKQEKWIYENARLMPEIKWFMGVGGTFDFLAGVVKRAPLLMRKIGLEWVYRLYKQPQRFKRIFNATVVFVFLALKDLWRKPSE